MGELFANFVRALPKSFQVEVVRYPPDSCRTYAEVATFLCTNGLDREPLVVLAESFSVPAAIAWAATSPPNLRGLILCGGCASSPLPGWLRFFYSLAPRFALRQPRSSLGIRCLLVGMDAVPSLVSQVKTVIASLDRSVMRARLQAISACDARAEFAALTLPILLLHAKQDRLIGRAKLSEMRTLQPAAAVELLDGPHLLLQREPQKTARLVAHFIQRVL